MRRLILPLAVLLCLALASSAGAATIFILKGRGWGHGVGMSQWGAFAQAKEGTGYSAILAHYYRGTTVVTRSNKVVNVELASGRSSVRVGSAAPFKVGAKEHAAGSALVTPTSTGGIKVEGISKTFASPLTFAPTSAPLALNGPRYRGKLVVSVSAGRLRVLNRLRMEAYIRGVVPRESPSWWPLEALKAQAVAARSYAFALAGKCGGAYCPDTRDQVYGGLDGETAATNQAVADTTGEVLEHSGSVIPTYFHSSSGGKTAASIDVWSCDCPYLQSEPDFDLVPENPNRLWFVRLTPKQLGARLGAKKPTDATLTRNGSDRAQRLTISGAWGSKAVTGSETLRFRLGVKSSRFWIGILRLNTPVKRVVFKTTTSLATYVQEINGTVLEGRPAGGAWEALAAVGAGAGSTAVRPTRTTTYRLASNWGRSPRVQVLVAAKINFAVEQPPDGLAGIVKPKALAGTPVAIQRKSSAGWKTVATATVAASGAFKGTFAVRAGKYRAVVKPAAASGLVKGVSPVLTLTTG